MKDYYQALGALVVGGLPPRFRKALLYVEAEDGVVGPSLFYETADGRVFYSPTSPAMARMAYDFWTEWKLENPPWRTLAFTLEAGRFKADLKYADQVSEDEPEWERRPRILQEHFAGKDVIYPGR